MKTLEFLIDNWGIISLVALSIYELAYRVTPTEKNYSLIQGIIETIGKLLKHWDRRKGVVIGLLCLITSLGGFDSLAQLNGTFKLVKADSIKARQTNVPLNFPYNYGSYPDITVNDTTLYEWITHHGGGSFWNLGGTSTLTSTNDIISGANTVRIRNNAFGTPPQASFHKEPTFILLDVTNSEHNNDLFIGGDNASISIQSTESLAGYSSLEMDTLNVYLRNYGNGDTLITEMFWEPGKMFFNTTFDKFGGQSTYWNMDSISYVLQSDHIADESSGTFTFSAVSSSTIITNTTSGANTGIESEIAIGTATYFNDGADQSEIRVSDASMLVTDEINTKGLEYQSDYSANFTDRSLVDKGFVQGYLTATLTDGTPTEAEINTATGLTPVTAGAGRRFYIKDTNGTSLIYIVISDGTDWYYIPINFVAS